MPKRGAAQPGRGAPTENQGVEETAEEAAYNDAVAEPPQSPEPARRRGRRSRVEEGAKSEAGADMDGQLPPDEPEEDKPRRGRVAREKAERPKHATADVAERKYDFSDIDATELAFGSLDDEDSDEFISLLYYGREGTIKTTSALQMTRLPEKGDVLLINAEGGAKKRALAKHGVNLSRVKTWPAPGKRVTFDGLEALFYRLAADLDKDPDSWLGVVWDSGTEIVQTMLDQIVEGVIEDQQEILARTKGRAGNIELRDRFDNDRDDYRKMSNMVRGLVRKYRYLPCHFVMTALLREDEKKVGKSVRVTYSPAFTPSLASDILGYMDSVLYCKKTANKGKVVYYATTVEASDDRAKDRYDALPKELVEPGFDRVAAYIRDELESSTDPIQNKMPGGATDREDDSDDAPAAEEPAKPARRARPSRAQKASVVEPAADEAQADSQMSEVPGHKPALEDDPAEAEIRDRENTPELEESKPARRRGSRRATAEPAAKADEAEMSAAERAVIEEQRSRRAVKEEIADKEGTPASRTRTTARQRRASASNAKPAPKNGVKYNGEPPF